MAVAWKSQSSTVSAARAGSTATYSMTVTYPSMAIGDAVFIVAANWNNTGPNLWTQPTGYNTIASSQFSTSFFYRLVDGTEGASINITMPSGNAIYGTQVYCTVFSGVTSVDSAHSNYIQQTTAGSSSPDCPWLTTIGANDRGQVVRLPRHSDLPRRNVRCADTSDRRVHQQRGGHVGIPAERVQHPRRRHIHGQRDDLGSDERGHAWRGPVREHRVL
jgi:hypothetical protein